MDQRYLTFLNRTAKTPELDLLMLFFSYLLPAVLLILLVYYCFKHRTALGGSLLVALVISILSALLLQYMGMRPRPDNVRLIAPQPEFYSYPSGHTAAAFALMMVIWLYDRRLSSWLGTLVLASGIGISRIYLGHHWPSDILGGMVLGMSIGAAIFGLFLNNMKGLERWRWLVWLQIGFVLVVTQMAYLNYLPFHLLRWQYADKVLHFILAGLVTFWLHIWLRGRTTRILGIPLPLAIVLVFLIALVDEGFQYLSPIRNADLIDLASDLGGMIFFWIPSHLIVWWS
ncbi:MAG: VanZ family protein, partial [Calditrichota bacterium]